MSVFDTEDLHEAPIERVVMGDLEPVRSRFNLNYGTLLRLVEHLGGRVEEAWERSFNRYQFETSTPERRRKNREKQLEALRRKLELLARAGFRDEKGLTDRGKFAARLSAFELQFAECYFRGIFEDLPPRARSPRLSLGLSTRSGRGDDGAVGAERLRSGQTQDYRGGALAEAEGDGAQDQRGDQAPRFLADRCHLCVVRRRSDRCALERHTQTAPGDVVRTFRLAVQCLRNMEAVLRGAYGLPERLATATAMLNRDEVDAQRQLELGGVEVPGEDRLP